MPATHISVAHAKARFSALLEGVFHRGERYVIERHGREVAALVSPSELRRLNREAPLAERVPMGGGQTDGESPARALRTSVRAKSFPLKRSGSPRSRASR